MTLEQFLSLLNVLIAAVAIGLALVALRVAKTTLELEKEAVHMHRLERRLKALDELARAIYEVGLHAAFAIGGKEDKESIGAARGRLQVAMSRYGRPALLQEAER